MPLTREEKRRLADRVKAHMALLVDSPDGLDDFLDEDYEVRQDVREQIGAWMARLPGSYWDSSNFGRRPR